MPRPAWVEFGGRIIGVKPVRVAGLAIGGGSPLVLIAGPCVIENESHALGLARSLRDIAQRVGVQFIFKASYDKANRTSSQSYRGPGLTEGLRVLRRVRDDVGVPILTDIHEPAQAIEAARSRRRPADPRVPLAADRSARSRGENGTGRQYQEGSIPRARRRALRNRQSDRVPAMTRSW